MVVAQHPYYSPYYYLITEHKGTKPSTENDALRGGHVGSTSPSAARSKKAVCYGVTTFVPICSAHMSESGDGTKYHRVCRAVSRAVDAAAVV